MEYLSYLFWPNPPAPAYSSPKVLAILLLCSAMIVASFIVKRMQFRSSSAVVRKMIKSWSPILFWFGLVGLFMAVCRVEGISYLSMRFWWVLWALIGLVVAFFQWKMFRSRHYEVLPQQEEKNDPREKYLPKKKKR